jgi:hypothetical protein
MFGVLMLVVDGAAHGARAWGPPVASAGAVEDYTVGCALATCLSTTLATLELR